MDSEMRDILTAVLEGQQFLGARFEALSADIKDRFEALSTNMETHAADTIAKLDLLTVDMGAVKAQLVDVNERLHYLTHKTAELEQDMFVVKQKQGA